MFSNIIFSEKQEEYFNNANHRWNIKTGATRSGKTFMDYFVIPKRMRKCTGSGNIVLLGNTRPSVTRNIIEPMRAGWGDNLIGNIKIDGSINMFGKKAYVFGADNKASVNALRGMSIEYCYGDEMATWHEDVFGMLKSRLDKPNSTFDGTCNPENPNHWVRTFLNSNADIFKQSYSIYDNPFLAPEFVSNLELEYSGTVLFDRYIKGLWVAAEGVIYRNFADNAKLYYTSVNDVVNMDFAEINIGVDFGGTTSGTALVATGITNSGEVYALKSLLNKGLLDPHNLNSIFIRFVTEIIDRYGRADYAYCDSAESILIAGIKIASERAGLPTTIRNAIKRKIIDRIRLTSGLISQNRLHYTDDCDTLVGALSNALWNDKVVDDERLDNGTTDIDTLDAFEYTIERRFKDLLNIRGD